MFWFKLQKEFGDEWKHCAVKAAFYGVSDT